MKTTTTTWRLHPKTQARTLRGAFLVTTAVFVLAIWSIVFNNSQGVEWNLLLATAIYFGFCLAVAIRYLKNGVKNRLIFVRNNALSIPRCVMKRQIVPLDQIKSVETMSNSRIITAVIIGRFGKGPIYIGRTNFDSPEKFEVLVEFLKKIALSNQNPTSAKAIAALSTKSGKKNLVLMVVLVSTLLTIYSISTGDDIERISDHATSHGGLIKNTLQPDQFYRIASSFFLHASPLHLGLNILSLTIIGQFLEIILGRTRIINILFCSAASGSLLSLAFSPYDAVIGASGGIFGLVGAYFVTCAKFQRQLPGSVSCSTQGVFLVLFLQIFFDLTTDGTDIFSHIGGITFGIVYAGLALRRCNSIDEASESFTERHVARGVALFYSIGLAIFLGRYFSLII